MAKLGCVVRIVLFLVSTTPASPRQVHLNVFGESISRCRRRVTLNENSEVSHVTSCSFVHVLRLSAEKPLSGLDSLRGACCLWQAAAVWHVRHCGASLVTLLVSSSLFSPLSLTLLPSPSPSLWARFDLYHRWRCHRMRDNRPRTAVLTVSD